MLFGKIKMILKRFIEMKLQIKNGNFKWERRSSR